MDSVSRLSPKGGEFCNYRWSQERRLPFQPNPCNPLAGNVKFSIVRAPAYPRPNADTAAPSTEKRRGLFTLQEIETGQSLILLPTETNALIAAM